jgi:hypothetical protein
MPTATAMLRSHPHPHPEMDPILRCAHACFTCMQACGICADACLSEANVAKLTACIRLDLDCADICSATGQILQRLGRTRPQPLQAMLAACAEACRTCAEECRKHATMHDHCRICAEACEACYAACEDMMKSMRHAGESEGAGKA